MADGPATDTAARTHRGWGSLVLWILAILACYVLSTGPAQRMAQSGLFEESHLNRVYAPLGWVVDNSSTAQHFFTWYLRDVWRCEVLQ